MTKKKQSVLTLDADMANAERDESPGRTQDTLNSSTDSFKSAKHQVLDIETEGCTEVGQPEKVNVDNNTVDKDTVSFIGRNLVGTDEESDIQITECENIIQKKYMNEEYGKTETMYNNNLFDDLNVNIKDDSSCGNGEEKTTQEGAVSNEIHDTEERPEKIKFVKETVIVSEKPTNKRAPKSDGMGDVENAYEQSMEGFTETFELTVPQMEYNLMLRRTKTNEKQDNRLVIGFDLPANTGCVYTSRRSSEDQLKSATNTQNFGTRKELSLPFVKNKTANKQRPEVQKHPSTSKPTTSKDQRANSKQSVMWKTTPMKADLLNQSSPTVKSSDTKFSNGGAELSSVKPLNVETLNSKEQKSITAVTESGKTNQNREYSETRTHKDTDGSERTIEDKKAHPESGGVKLKGLPTTQMCVSALEQMGTSVKHLGDGTFLLDDQVLQIDAQVATNFCSVHSSRCAFFST